MLAYSNGSWIALDSPSPARPSARCSHGMAASEGLIYVHGGITVTGQQTGAEVATYHASLMTVQGSLTSSGPSTRTRTAGQDSSSHLRFRRERSRA
eukprot:750016-Hanusia_phi.AAC.2